MKYLPSTLFTGLLALSLCAQTTPPAGDPFVKNANDAAAGAVDPNNDVDNFLNCVFVLETYALDKHDAAAVLEAEQGSTARYRRVLDLAKGGKARLEALTALTTKSGQRAVIEAIDEVPTASEFAPPAAGKNMATPIAWLTRNTGDTFEIEPVILPDGRTCDLNLVPQHISLAGFRDDVLSTGNAPVSEPTFNSQKITTSTTAVDNVPHYLGSFSPPPPQGMANGEAASEMWLLFLHVNLQGPAGPLPKPAANQEPESLVNLDYSCYSLERAQAREILVSPASIKAPWEKLQALLAEKKARLEHFTSVRTKSGQRMVVEEIQEVRYFAEQKAETRTTSNETISRHPTKNGNEPPANPKPSPGINETAESTRVDTKAEVIPASAFTTRNTGVTVEVEPVIGPTMHVVDLNHVVQGVKYLGNLKVTGVATSYPPQPLFETSKVTTSQSIPVGQHVLVSTMNPPSVDGVNDRVDSGRVWLLFVRATLGDH